LHLLPRLPVGHGQLEKETFFIFLHVRPMMGVENVDQRPGVDL
jgi:hypothetical protein